MRIIVFFIAICIIATTCEQRSHNPKAIPKKVNTAWLDSLIKSSDSSYTKPYKRDDFVTAAFYITKWDSSICQVMKDSAGTIRQIIIASKDIRVFFAQYYANGQLQATLPLDEPGQYHGTATWYYEDGSTQSTGDYIHGLKTGQWQNFDEKGKLVSTVRYDKNGQAVP